MKRLFTFVLTLLMISVSFSENVFALPYVRYLDRTWNGTKIVEEYKTIEDNYRSVNDLSSNASVTLDSGKWVVHSDKEFKNRVKINGNVELIIDATLTCQNGIEVPKGSTLTIYGGDDRYSELYANIPSGSEHAAIGSNSGATGGTIIIKSGHISTYNNKGNKNAGIGGGNNATFEKIEIYGGSIEVHGSDGGAGIGNGATYTGSTCGEVIIYGGNITSLAGNGAAGIGGGVNGYGVKTTIWSGTINAEGASYIEDGFFSDTEYSGAGIGGGGNRGQARDIYIYGGTVKATGSGTALGSAGIGGGSDSSGGKVVIGGEGLNCNVIAKGGPNAAGIGAGAGKDKNGGNVELKSGVLEAYANTGLHIEGEAYAISGCDGGNNGKLSIPDDAKVTYGNSLGGSKNIALKNDRVNKVQNSIYARIDGCEHTDANYIEIDAFKHHVECKHCLTEFDEVHSFDGNSTICNKQCGYKGITISFAPGFNGEGHMDDVIVNPGDYVVPENKFTPKTVTYNQFLIWQPTVGDELLDPINPGEKIYVKENVTFTAAWDTKKNYKVDIAAVENGSVELDNAQWHGLYPETAEVVLIVNPDEGKDVVRVWYTDKDNNQVDIIDKKTDGRYYFSMPAKDITVHATFGDPVAVTGVSLNKEELEINEGNGEQLIATVRPDNASDKRATWSSSDDTIVRVDDKGNIFGLTQGSATITVTTVDGNHTATCIVTVKHVHNVSNVDEVAPTCEGKGSIEHYVCDQGEYHCDKYFSDAEATNEITTADIEVAALGHDWGEWVVIEEPQEYIVPGLDRRVCKRDSTHIQERQTDPTGHQCKNHLKIVEKVDPTCTKNGYLKHYECECGKLYTDTEAEREIESFAEFEIDPLGHDPKEPTTEPIAAPTCTEDGSHYEIVICDRCKEELSRKTIVDKALGHEWGPYVVTREATVFEEGVKTSYCSHDSNHTQTESIPTIVDTLEIYKVEQATGAIGNRFTATARVLDPNGNIDNSIGLNNARATMKFDNKGVTESINSANNINGTGELQGSSEGIEHTITLQLATKQQPVRTIAPRVSKTIKVITPELSLESSCFDEESNTATITVEGNQGQTIRYFKDTGNVTDAIINSAKTATGNQITVNEPGKYYVFTTPSQDGDTFYTRSFLSLAGGELPDSIDVAGHEWSKEVHYDWLEDNTKVTASRVCLKDETHVQEETVGVSSVTTSPTCEENGNTIYTSEEFGNTAFEKQVKMIAIEALGHDWSEWTTVVEPTCETAGKQERVCSHDSTHKEEREIKAIGHDWSEWVVTKKPTLDEEGLKERVCSHDPSHKQSQVIPKLESPYVNTKGNGNIWYMSSGITSDFTFENVIDDSITYPNFIGIRVDGKDVSKDNYTYEKGSVIIKLIPSYLETLSVGRHTLTALFKDDMRATAEFIITRVSDNNNNNNNDHKSNIPIPKTGIE